jgi:hypothetical protein
MLEIEEKIDSKRNFLRGLGDRLEEFRLILGLDKGEYSQKLGIKAAHYSKFRNGSLDPLNLLDNLKSLGMDEVWFLTGIRPENSNASMKIENGTYNNSNISMFTKEQKTGYVSDVQSKLIGELTTENTLLKQKIKDLEAELLRAKGNA